MSDGSLQLKTDYLRFDAHGYVYKTGSTPRVGLNYVLFRSVLVPIFYLGKSVL